MNVKYILYIVIISALDGINVNPFANLPDPPSPNPSNSENDRYAAPISETSNPPSHLEPQMYEQQPQYLVEVKQPYYQTPYPPPVAEALQVDPTISYISSANEDSKQAFSPTAPVVTKKPETTVTPPPSEGSKVIVQRIQQRKASHQAIVTELGRYRCPATILDGLHLITAARCFFRLITSKRAESDQFKNWKVVVGQQKNLPAGIVQEIQRIVINPDFHLSNGYDHDLAVIQLKIRLVFSEFVQPIKLYQGKASEGDVLTVMLRDKESSRDSNRALFAVKMTQIGLDECLLMLPNEASSVTITMECAWADVNRCPNHEGGAVLFKGGLLAITTDIGNEENEEVSDTCYPLVYTSLYDYQLWITSVTTRNRNTI